jgi:hypothetical protein
MHARSATGTPVPPTSPQPLAVPPRWRLRTQVSRKTLFELIQDTLPAAGLQVTGATPDDVHDLTDHAVETAEPGVLPRSYLDPLATTIPMPIHAPALWNDGDTTPDLPDRSRPITITLASPPALQPPPALPPSPGPALRRRLHEAVRTAGWMLSGAALTFLISAAAFGGKPMLRAMRNVTGAHAQTSPDGPIPATNSPPPPLPVPAHAPQPGRAAPAAVSVADGRKADLPPIATAASRGSPVVDTEGDAAPEGNPGDRGSGMAAVRAAHRARQGRRLASAATLTEAGHPESLPPGSDDAVMPLASSGEETHVEIASPRVTTFTKSVAIAKAPAIAATPVIVKSPAIVKAISSRVFRPIDIEDPFGGR